MEINVPEYGGQEHLFYPKWGKKELISVSLSQSTEPLVFSSPLDCPSPREFRPAKAHVTLSHF